MAEESLALAKFACPSCGGEAVWNPTKQKLVCPYCGTESPAKLDAGGAIVEHDLVAALRGLGDERRDWGSAMRDRRQVRCQSCNAISVLDPARQAQNWYSKPHLLLRKAILNRLNRKTWLILRFL